MAERLKAPDLKSGIGLVSIRGSNPLPTAYPGDSPLASLPVFQFVAFSWQKIAFFHDQVNDSLYFAANLGRKAEKVSGRKKRQFGIPLSMIPLVRITYSPLTRETRR